MNSGELLAGRFRLERRLGEGGLGQVYAATDLQTKTTVAIKAVLPSLLKDAFAIGELKRDLMVSRLVGHPGVLRAYDLYEHETHCFLVLEHFESQSADHLLSQQPRQRFPFREACHLAVRVADVLCALHAAGIVHCDVKPGNVLVNRQGDVKLIDFGIAHLPAEQGVISGDCNSATIGFAPPEQLRGGRPSPQWDVYAFGCFFHTLLTGAPPNANALSEELKHATLGIPPACAKKVTRLLSRCLAAEAERQAYSMVDVRTELVNVTAHELSAPSREPQRIVAVAGVLASVALVGWWTVSGPGSPGEAPQYRDDAPGEASTLSVDPAVQLELQRARAFMRVGRLADARVLLSDLHEREPDSIEIADLLTSIAPSPDQYPTPTRSLPVPSADTPDATALLRERTASSAAEGVEASASQSVPVNQVAEATTDLAERIAAERQAAALLAQGVAAFERAQYSDAERSVRGSLSIAVTEEAKVLLGRIERAKAAEQSFNSAPRQAAAAFAQAQALFAQGRYDEAERAVRASLVAAVTSEAQVLLDRIQRARQLERALRGDRPQ